MAGFSALASAFGFVAFGAALAGFSALALGLRLRRPWAAALAGLAAALAGFAALASAFGFAARGFAGFGAALAFSDPVVPGVASSTLFLLSSAATTTYP